MIRWCSILSLSFAAGLAVAGQADWIKFQSPQGHYSVLVPTEPKLSSRERTTANGKKVLQYLASATDGVEAFMVGYYDYPANMIFSLETARDEMVSHLNGSLLSDKWIRLDGIPGREIRILAKTGDGTQVVDRVRFGNTRKRIYILQCIFPRDEEGPAVIARCDKFVDSFKITN
jgi:hypothetical protein